MADPSRAEAIGRAARAGALALGCAMAVLGGCSTPGTSAPPTPGNSTAAASPTPGSTAMPAGWSESEVTFATAAGTAYGTVVRPDGGRAAPGALLIAGSGPTDRNGDQRGFTTGALRGLAAMLARAGVVSLRYDKLGSGATGMGTVGDPASISVDTFADQAAAALQTLAASPGVDPARIVVVGHSEGALFAQVLAGRPAGDAAHVSRVALLMPLSLRYLDLLGKQVKTRLLAAAALGQIGAEQATTLRSQLDSAIAATRAGTPVPSVDPTLAALFAPVNAAFLRTADALDPVALARATPAGVPVLVVCGTDDVQVDCSDARGLAEAVPTGAGRLLELRGVSHVLKVDASRDPSRYTADLPYSPELEAALTAFVTG